MNKRQDRIKHIFSDKEHTEIKSYSKKKAGIILSAISVTLCVLSVAGIIILNKLSAEYENSNILRDFIARNPVISAFIMIAICTLQVVIAFIPGEVVEVAAGYAFGAWLGALLCTVGITLGSIISILLARRFGRRLLTAFYSPKKLESIPVLNDSQKRNTLVAILYLIPGTPKDLITYLIGLTEMSIPTYVAITVFCRFPSIITSTLSGDAMGEQKWMAAFWFFIITGALSGIGYFIYIVIKKKISSAKEHNHSTKNSSEDSD